uniref:ISXO2-like transposase domain-containing protein n=1 Tax=Candidatus Kentrum eta TaxID=2126337 RepID=A0A450VFI4_9GAMM|nr:MAG: hypothetical protein BECKH772B_GA0070898_103573 [Candidatus Kentron sp. H]VFK03925.1 MAG: hypothetical protein BECKH772A_GA0070896_103663 [Candidatus Kentron sp. H]VFK06922.1 MAG: hypothetical protein BECKH772C_GA0070978_103842 [Candidatus Kentron sp. H]
MVCHSHGEYARDEEGDGFCEVHVNTMEGFWSLPRSRLRPHRGISQEFLPGYLGFFEFVHNVKYRDKRFLVSLTYFGSFSSNNLEFDKSLIQLLLLGVESRSVKTKAKLVLFYIAVIQKVF